MTLAAPSSRELEAGRTLVIGAAGQVGGALVELLSAEGVPVTGTYHETPREDALPFDLHAAATQRACAEKLLAVASPNTVIITAGMTWVDGCEDEPDRAAAINRDGPAVLARAARDAGARTVYFSTEYVFDGESGPYGEDDTPRPISVYGRTKLEGEHAVQGEDPAALIVRTTVVYGPEVRGKNFAYQLAARLRAGEVLNAPVDQVSSPTYNRDLAAATLGLLRSGARGVFHVVGPELLDRAEFARRLARCIGCDDSLVAAVSTKTLRQRAARPLRAGLRTERLRDVLPHLHLRSVEEAAKHWQSNQRGLAWPT